MRRENRMESGMSSSDKGGNVRRVWRDGNDTHKMKEGWKEGGGDGVNTR